jgi:hypothetical protein
MFMDVTGQALRIRDARGMHGISGITYIILDVDV